MSNTRDSKLFDQNNMAKIQAGSVNEHHREDLDFLGRAITSLCNFQHLSSGGQSSVWLAREKSTSRTVVVKLLLNGPFATLKSKKRFEREARILQKLHHPNIVRVLDYKELLGRQFIIMEFVSGMNIDDYAYALKSDLDERLKIMSQVCRAIYASHDAGVLHRDLKPSNILVRDNKTPCIIDFGLSKDYTTGLESGSIITTSSGDRVGTTAYLSPEQLKRKVIVDERTDIYALGVVLFEIVIGQFPYPDHDLPFSIIRNIAIEEPISLSRAIGDCRHSYDEPRNKITKLDTIIRKAMDKDPDRRYQTTVEMADDIDRLLSGKSIRASCGASRRRMERFWHRRKKTLIVSCVILIALVVAGGSLLDQLSARKSLLHTEHLLKQEKFASFRSLQNKHSYDVRDNVLPRLDMGDSFWVTSLVHEGNLALRLLSQDPVAVAEANQWLDGHVQAINGFSEELSRTVFFLSIKDVGGRADSVDTKTMKFADSAFDALVAMAIYCGYKDDIKAFCYYYKAAQNLAIDFGCNPHYIYKGEATKYRIALLHVLSMQTHKCLNSLSACDQISRLVFDRPIPLHMASVASQQGIANYRKAIEASSIKNNALWVDCQKFNESLGGRFDSLDFDWRSEWPSLVPLSDFDRIMDEYTLINSKLGKMNLNEIVGFSEDKWKHLHKDRLKTPFAHFFNIYDKMYMRIVAIRSRERALKIILKIAEYRSEHKAWPQSLNQIMANSSAIIEPMSGELFEYHAAGSGFRLQSPLINESVAQLIVKRDWQYGFIYREGRFIFFEP